MSKPDAADPLAEAFADDPGAVSACPVGKMLAEASDKARERVQLWLDSKDASGQEIIRRLRNQARVQMNKDTLSRHRRRECRCFRSND